MTKIFRRSALVIAISVLVIGFSSYAVYQAFTSAPKVPVQAAPAVPEPTVDPAKVTEEPTTTSPVPKSTAPIEAVAVSFTRPSPATLPQEVRSWVENSLKFDMGHFANAKEFDDKQYLFVRSGTGGFEPSERLVQIVGVLIMGEEVAVKVSFTKPAYGQQIPPDDLYDVVFIAATGLPVRVVPLADEAIFVDSLTGIHYLPDIVAHSRTIKLFAPAPGKVVGRNFRVSGVANVFEATVNYRLSDAEQNTLAGHFITALQVAPGFTRDPILQHGWGNWRYFSMGIQVPESVVAGDVLTLVLSPYDPVSPSEREILGPLARVRVPLKFELR